MTNRSEKAEVSEGMTSLANPQPNNSGLIVSNEVIGGVRGTSAIAGFVRLSESCDDGSVNQGIAPILGRVASKFVHVAIGLHSV
jgi:hypothetical protein